MTPQARPGRGGHAVALREKVVALIAAGHPFRDVAADLGLSTGTVWAWSKKAGVKGRSVKGMAPTCHAERPAYGRRLCRKCYMRLWRVADLPEVE